MILGPRYRVSRSTGLDRVFELLLYRETCQSFPCCFLPHTYPSFTVFLPSLSQIMAVDIDLVGWNRAQAERYCQRTCHSLCCSYILLSPFSTTVAAATLIVFEHGERPCHVLQ